MKILLISPSAKKSFWGSINFPGLGLPLLAGLTPAGVEVKIIDEANKPLTDFPAADMVGISVLTAAANRAYQIADKYRSMNIPVVLGGMHTSALPEEGLQHADAVVVGEADELWPTIINDFDNNQLKPIYKAPRHPSIENQPAPRWDLIDDSVFNPMKTTIYSVQTGRGCPNRCNFCNVTEMFGRAYRKRPIPAIIEEIQSIGRTRLLIIDDNLIVDLKFAGELLTEMIPLKKEWMCLASITNLHREEILKLLRDAGCQHIFIGFETTNPENIDFIDKKVNKTEKYQDIIKRIHDYGIKIIGSFIVGLDYDDEGVFEQIYNFIRVNKIFVPVVNILTPYPGTQIFRNFQSENRILSYDWVKYSCDEVVFRPKNMTPEKLASEHAKLQTELSKLTRRSSRDYNTPGF